MGHDSGASSNVFGSDTQYSDSAGHIAYNLSSDPSTLDTNPFPSDVTTYPRAGCPATIPSYGGIGSIASGSPAACITDTEIVTEVESLIAANHWPSGFSTQYVVFLPYGVDECIDWAPGTPCFESNFCAYHTWDGSSTSPNIVYAVEPESALSDAACWPQSMGGANNNDADVVISSLSHELNETITDPTQGGWYDIHGNEDGDKCAYNYGSSLGSGPFGGGAYNQYINGHAYITQREWSNALNGCYQVGPPKITSVAPPTSPANTWITLNGANFFAAYPDSPTVLLNGRPAQSSQSFDGTQLNVYVPDTAGTAGHITVKALAGTVVSSQVFGMQPVLSSISAAQGFAGDAVTLTGTGFYGVTHVTFNGVPGTFRSVAANGTSLVAVVPTAATSGNVAVTTSGGSSTDVHTFTVDPKITSLTPAAAAGMATVTIAGTGLAGATQVAFNGDASPQIVSDTATKVVATVPADATNGPLTVTTAAGTSAPSAASFKPLPKIASITGDPAQTGSTVIVNGYDFTPTGAAPTVKLGTTVLTPSGTTPTSFSVTVPDGMVTGVLTVTTPNGSTTAKLHIEPTISGAPSPSSGPAGTVVTLTGATFAGTTHVTVGGVTSVFAIVDYHHLHVTIPPGAISGPIAVTNAGGAVTSSSFAVTPKITAVAPASAAGMANVAVTGTGLAGATQVAFNGDPSPQIVSSTATTVVAKVPVDATNGPITVTTSAGTSLPSSATFKPLPKISSITGDPGQVGDTVTVNGYDFNPTGATPTVKLGTAAITPGSPTATSFTVTIPDGALSGPITVSDANGTTTATLHVKPTISAAPSPTHGQAGTVVTLTGATFPGTSHVTVGGVTAAFAVVDYHHLHVTIPVTAVSGAIVVTNAGGSTSSSTFTVDPKVTLLSPSSGATGSAVTIAGSGLAGATAVDFTGGVSATPTASTATAVHVVVPAGATTGPVTVHTASSVTATSVSSFTVTFSVTGISPSIAAVGDVVRITGNGFTGVTAVKFNGHSASFAVLDASDILAHVPAGGATGTVSVSKSTLTVNAPQPFTLLTLTGIAPASAAPGGTVTITGTGLTGATGVTFSNHPAASYTVNSDTQITATVPVGFAGGSGSVAVTANGGSSKVFGDLALLAVTGYSVADAAPGTQIEIDGSGFTGATGVSFNGTSTTAHVVDDSHVDATVPLDATSGPISVTGPGGTATGSTFTIDRATLRLNEIAPNLAGSQALIELYAVNGGGVGGTTIVYDDGSGSTTLATLPAFTVTAGQLIVVHVNSSGTNETSTQTDCNDAACYANAWDEFAPGVTLPFSSVTLELADGAGNAQDGAAFVTSATPGASYATALAALQATGLWAPANCGGAACSDASTPTAAGVSVDWSGVGTNPSGNTIQRVGTDSPNDAANWTLAPGTIGAAN